MTKHVEAIVVTVHWLSAEPEKFDLFRVEGQSENTLVDFDTATLSIRRTPTSYRHIPLTAMRYFDIERFPLKHEGD